MKDAVGEMLFVVCDSDRESLLFLLFLLFWRKEWREVCGDMGCGATTVLGCAIWESE